MSGYCVICRGDGTEGEILVPAPCGKHWICTEDVVRYFERATANESLFPPRCCDKIFLLEEYGRYVPFEVSWAYQVKQHVEYAFLAKSRLYCSNALCAKFLHPSFHFTSNDDRVKFAICVVDDCGTYTCISCKQSVYQDIQDHICQSNKDEEMFQRMITEKGYQTCSVCGAVVELAEACNHITCECGYNFCYICGKRWAGLHECPQYGVPRYDKEGYNQDGFHRETGLDDEGLTRGQQSARNRQELGDAADEQEEEDDEAMDREWEILRYVNLSGRQAVNTLEGPAREVALRTLWHRIYVTSVLVESDEEELDDEDETEIQQREQMTDTHERSVDGESTDPARNHTVEQREQTMNIHERSVSSESAYPTRNYTIEGLSRWYQGPWDEFILPRTNRPTGFTNTRDDDSDRAAFHRIPTPTPEPTRPEWFPPIGGWPEDEQL